MAFVAVVTRVVPANAAAVEMVTANPTGAAWTALAEMTTTSPLAPTVTPRLAKNSRRRSTARLTRFCAASSDVPRVCADFAEGFVLEVAEQDGGAVGLVERGHGFVEQRFDVRPVGGGGVHGIHLGGDLFAQLAAGFAADDINGGAAGDLIEPRGEDGVGREAVRVAGEVGEGGLGDFLGELRRADLPERGGMDEVEVAADEFGEGVLGVLAGVAREQLQVGVAHFHQYIAAGQGNPTKFF